MLCKEMKYMACFHKLLNKNLNDPEEDEEQKFQMPFIIYQTKDNKQ